MTTNVPFLNTPYGGYLHNQVPPEDDELTHVGPGTPGGEWLRRFWHPVAVAEDLKNLPIAIRILDEELVLFRDGSGKIGLLELHCSHRGTSLEFGQIQKKGIRCCYHAWLYDIDGKILDTPGEPADSTLKDRLYHGAYPTLEYEGLVFAYMGPPDKRPVFPVYDSYHIKPDLPIAVETRYVQHSWPANWLQIRENALDISHFYFLHSMPGNGLGEGDAAVAADEMYSTLGSYDAAKHVEEYLDTPIGLACIDSRRVGDKVWVLITEYVPPTFNQIPEIEGDMKNRYAYNRAPWLRWWTVPIDDTNTMHIGYWYARAKDGEVQREAGFGLTAERPYEVRQQVPGDYDAQVSQRPIEVHALEHLANTDQGIIMLRNMVRRGIRAVQQNEDPEGVSFQDNGTISTYCHDRVLDAAPAPTPKEDQELLRTLGRQVMDEYVANLA
jgi:phenylpropionate dioxygenase-like ring-hydroxylating dioxygenase large terminal subunit